jgi:hypothetical protein
MQRNNNKVKSNWSAPMRKGIRSVDVSAVIYTLEAKKNPYIRPSNYRKIIPKHSTLIGSNSEIY